MVVQHNMQAMNANRMLNTTASQQAKSTEKLSSGYKINRAADDAAGLSISEKMRKQIRGLDRASANAQDGISAVQTAEGALGEVEDMLQRMNELAVQSANETNSESDRNDIQNEVNALVDEINRVSETTKFNETYLLKGDKDGDKPIDYTFKDVDTFAAKAGGAKLYIKNGSNDYSEATPELLKNATKDQIVKVVALGTADGKDASYTAAAENVDYTKTTEKASVFDKDGNKISANGIHNYYKDDVYQGGLYTDNKAVNEIAKGDATTLNKMIDNTGTKETGVLSFALQVGADSSSGNQITVSIDAMSAKSLGVEGIKVDGKNNANAKDAIETIKAAINNVSAQRSSLGATQNRLEHTINNLDNVVENTTSAESQIRDTDMAKEMVKYSKNNILAQAGQSMLAQANQSNQGVLSLLG